MKLSEAINLGSMLRPQTYDTFVDEDGTCAMGAALEAVGKLAKTNQTNEKRIRKIWPWLNWRFEMGTCPWCGVPGMTFKSVYGLILHWNDKDHGLRQSIAQYIQRIEEQARGQIDLLRPSERKKHLVQLEANLPAPKKSKKRTEDLTRCSHP